MLIHRAIIIILAACLLLAGCNGARETDEVAWVVTIGVDRAADGELLVTYRIAVPQAAGGDGGGGGDKKEPSVIITVKAPTLAETRNILNAAISREVSLTHVTAIILSEKLARSGVQDLIGPLLRFREFRGPIFLIVARGVDVDELFRANKPEIESLVSRWVHNYMHHFDDTAYYLPLNLHEFYIRLKETSGGAPLAVGYGLNPLTGRQPARAVQPGDNVKTYLAGDLPRQGGNPTEFAGTAVFREDKLAGFLDTAETRALAILLDKFTSGFLVVTDPLEPKRKINISLRNGRAPKFTFDLSERPAVNIDVLLEGEITAIPSGINYEKKEYLTLLEKQISDAVQEQILNMLVRTQGWGTDVVDFGYHIRPKFWTLREMWDYGWPQRFSQASFNVVVNTELRRSGLLRKTTPIRRD